MNKKQRNTKDLTSIALGVAAMIAGGIFIFQLSLIFPIPGMKYLLMAPFLSMMFMVVQSLVHAKYVVGKLGLTFGGIMMIFNLYMGVAILLTTILAQMTSLLIPFHNKHFLGSSFFAGYTGICALLISKYLIGGIYLEISNIWIVSVGLICFAFGMAGAFYAKKILRYLRPQMIDIN